MIWQATFFKGHAEQKPSVLKKTIPSLNLKYEMKYQAQ
jgi:hypothetical protein